MAVVPDETIGVDRTTTDNAIDAATTARDETSRSADDACNVPGISAPGLGPHRRRQGKP